METVQIAIIDGYKPITKINKALLKDVESVVGSIYRLNANWANFYCFNSTTDRKEIAYGIYESKVQYINTEYCLDLRTGQFYKAKK